MTRAVIVVLLCLATETHSAAPRPRGLLAELRHELGGTRWIEPMLTISQGHARCSVRPDSAGTPPRTSCPRPASSRAARRRIASLSARANAAVRASVDPEALHAAALIDLLYSDADDKALSRAISFLQNAARLSRQPSPILTDLAAAFLVRAERTHNPRDLLEAVEVADSAVALEPTARAATFNLALALGYAELTGEAIDAWRRYRLLDSVSPWGDEAGTRADALAGRTRVPVRPRVDAPDTALARYAMQAPQEARLWAWDEVLGTWGAAVLGGDTALARVQLRCAGMLGDGLRRRSGEATLLGAVREIEARAGDAKGVREMARAHRDFAAARAAYRATDYSVAGRRFAALLATDPPARALVRWTTVYRAATLGHAGLLGQAERLLTPEIARADTVREGALAAVAWSMLATTLLRTNRLQQSREAALTAVRHFSRMGEREHAGSAQYVAADAEFALGPTPAAYGSMHRALAALREHRGSVWLHNALSVTAEAAAGDALLRAAVRLQNEDVRVAARTGNPAYRAESHLIRAQLLNAAGDAGRAARDIETGRWLLDSIQGADARNWLGAELQLASATTLLRADPRRAATALDSVVRFTTQVGNPLRLLAALIGRAEARLALGQIAGAAADLDRATAVFVEQRDHIDDQPLRETLMGSARSVFDRLVMVELAKGDTLAALRRMERGRVALHPLSAAGGGARDRGWVLPAGQVAVEYALIADTLLVWTLSGDRVHLARARLDGAELGRTVDRVRSSLELRADQPALKADLAVLYDRLVRPVEALLGPEGTAITIIPDGEVADVPFAALFDTVRGRFLIERAALRMAASLSEAARPPSAWHPDRDRALLVANPAFRAGEFPSLAPLPAAEEEVRTIATYYDHPRRLGGATAGSLQVRQALAGSTIFHFAGHAIIDDDRPGQSFLLLAPPPDSRTSGRLTADTLETMDLGGLRVVVLSACETLRSHGGRSAGFSGLAGAFIRAGADGVVGSLWRVDDQATQPLMEAFHRAYRQTGNAADALRQAQLAMLWSSSASLRTPSAWAGFRYTGT